MCHRGTENAERGSRQPSAKPLAGPCATLAKRRQPRLPDDPAQKNGDAPETHRRFFCAEAYLPKLYSRATAISSSVFSLSAGTTEEWRTV